MKDAGKSERLFPFVALALAMSLGWAGWSTPSFGQASETQPVTSPVISPPPPGDVIPDNVPADTELGIPLGSFRLYPTLDVRAGYDTNVFASSAGQQTGSAYEAIRPSLDVRSDWNNHMLNFGGYGAFGFFNSAASQNYQNFGVNTDGRLDIYRDWYLTANAAFTGTTELLGTPDVAQTLSPSGRLGPDPVAIGRLCGAHQCGDVSAFQPALLSRSMPATRPCAIRISASSIPTHFLHGQPRSATSSPSHCGRPGYRTSRRLRCLAAGRAQSTQLPAASKHRRPTTRFQRLVGRGRKSSTLELKAASASSKGSSAIRSRIISIRASSPPPSRLA